MAQEGSDTWGRTIGFGGRPAILVVDLTRAFTEPSRPLGSDVSSTIAVANEILRAADYARVPAIFTAIAYDSLTFEDAGLWIAKVGGQDDLLVGGDGVEIDSRLHRTDTDELLIKKYASCFFGTELADHLRSRRVDTVILLGCSTSGCVRATAVDAIQYGFRPIVVRQGVCDRWPEAHEQSLKDMHAKYADVLDSDQVLTYLDGLSNGSET